MRISDWSSDVCSSDLLVTPSTSTTWPTSKMSALISPPTLKSAILSSATRSSHRPRPASPLALPRWPDSGLLTSAARLTPTARSEEQTSEPQSLMRTSYALFCLKHKKEHLSLQH